MLPTVALAAQVCGLLLNWLTELYSDPSSTMDGTVGVRRTGHDFATKLVAELAAAAARKNGVVAPAAVAPAAAPALPASLPDR